MRLTDLSLWDDLAGLVGAFLFDRGFMKLPQFRPHGLVIRLIDNQIDSRPASVCAGAIHQEAQFLLAGLGGDQPLGDILAAEKLKFCRRYKRIADDVEGC